LQFGLQKITVRRSSQRLIDSIDPQRTQFVSGGHFGHHSDCYTKTDQADGNKKPKPVIVFRQALHSL
jgi:hypothetical protein